MLRGNERPGRAKNALGGGRIKAFSYGEPRTASKSVADT